MDARHVTRLFSQYAKGYHAGAFATPLLPDVEAAQQAGLLHQWPLPLPVVALEQRARQVHTMTDFTGQRVRMPPGSRILRYLATQGAALPDLQPFHYVYAYLEDHALVAGLRAQGFTLHAVRISAASELIGLFWQGPPTRYATADRATLVELPVAVPADLQARVLAQLATLQGWRDDDPYYHHGEWSHLSLRGFQPDDMTWGVKPAEMSKAWKADHPEAARLRVCDWTPLAQHAPALRELLALVPWWTRFERIRLLRLTHGQLTRHTDITDRSAGTQPGKIVRFHLPLTTHPSIRTHAWDLEGQPQQMHWAPWHLYYLDQRKPHAVVNPSSVVRIHLVVDVVSDPVVRAQIAACYQAQEGVCTPSA